MKKLHDHATQLWQETADNGAFVVECWQMDSDPEDGLLLVKKADGELVFFKSVGILDHGVRPDPGDVYQWKQTAIEAIDDYLGLHDAPRRA